MSTPAAEYVKLPRFLSSAKVMLPMVRVPTILSGTRKDAPLGGLRGALEVLRLEPPRGQPQPAEIGIAARHHDQHRTEFQRANDNCALRELDGQHLVIAALQLEAEGGHDEVAVGSRG